MWLGILYVKKGLLLVAGVYMAWETRYTGDNLETFLGFLNVINLFGVEIQKSRHSGAERFALYWHERVQRRVD